MHIPERNVLTEELLTSDRLSPVLPNHLRTHEAQGFVAGETIAQYELGTMRNFVYLILDPETLEAAIVDPQRDLRPVVDLETQGYRLTSVLLTHTHHDHIAGVPELVERYPDLPIRVHPHDVHRLKKIPPSRIHPLSDGEKLFVGKTECQAIHSPGHSAGELCYLVEGKYLLTGDTLFIRDCGRTDLETGDTAEMFTTLQKIKKLPDDLVILPGHHYAAETASRLGTEKLSSPPLLCRSVEELKNLP